MWEPARTDFPGDVEMTGGHHCDDDEFEDNGVAMGGPTKSYTRETSGAGRYICYLAVVLGITAAGLSFAFGPAPFWWGVANDDDEPRIYKTAVSIDSVIQNPNYDVILKVPVATVEGDLVMYKHKKTQTPVMTIIPDDKEQDSVFAISYRTVPTNSHGPAHVLEHR